MEGYPVVLSLSGKRCLLVGGGRVAQRKVQRLLRAGAVVTVIAPELTGGLMTLAGQSKITWEKRPYREGDVGGFFLVFAASSDPAVNQRVAREAEEKGVLCSVADAPEISSFLTPAVLEREGILIAIGSGGKSPFLVRFLREWLGANLPRDLGRVLQVLEEERRVLKGTGMSFQEKKRRYQALIERWRASLEGAGK